MCKDVGWLFIFVKRPILIYQNIFRYSWYDIGSYHISTCNILTISVFRYGISSVPYHCDMIYDSDIIIGIPYHCQSTSTRTYCQWHCIMYEHTMSWYGGRYTMDHSLSRIGVLCHPLYLNSILAAWECLPQSGSVHSVGDNVHDVTTSLRKLANA